MLEYKLDNKLREFSHVPGPAASWESRELVDFGCASASLCMSWDRWGGGEVTDRSVPQVTW